MNDLGFKQLAASTTAPAYQAVADDNCRFMGNFPADQFTPAFSRKSV
ncbi:MAG: hypothetical protein INF93_08315 [Rhodobacter sp.]|nr:hypothetical protein [Rhodobacter sp.]